MSSVIHHTESNIYKQTAQTAAVQSESGVGATEHRGKTQRNTRNKQLYLRCGDATRGIKRYR